MQQELFDPRGRSSRRAGPARTRLRHVLPAALCLMGLAAAGTAQAIEFGPFSLTGFAKASAGWVSNGCENCQRDPDATRHFIWADDIVFGRKFGGLTTDSVQIQPTLGGRHSLGGVLFL